MKHRLPRRRSTRSRALLSVAALGVAVLLAGVDLPSALGAFTPKITGSANTAATATYFTCANAALGESGTRSAVTYPFDETSGTTAADTNGYSPGTYSNVTLGTRNTGSASVCPRDNNTVVTLNGRNSYIAGPSTGASSPNAFSIEVWFKTTTAQGTLMAFGNNRTGSSSVRIAQVYIDANRAVRYSLLSGGTRYSTASDGSVVDGAWHHVVATFSTSAGMALYIDGEAADAPSPNPKTIDSVGNNSGYYKFGMEDMSGQPARSSSGYFAGSLAFGSGYLYALSPAQASAHYDAGD